jgi:23S rRNA (cytosine1962-C5)-methyltransferase
VGDFFRIVGKLKANGTLFDCIFLDPPYFSTSERGRVDLFANSTRLINKVRPLVAHQGFLITVNNALFLSGEAYYQELQGICSDGLQD